MSFVFVAFWKSGSSPDTFKCDSLSCFGSCLKKIEIDTRSLEAAMTQPFFMVIRMLLGATLGLETRCQLILEQFSCDGFGRLQIFPRALIGKSLVCSLDLQG